MHHYCYCWSHYRADCYLCHYWCSSRASAAADASCNCACAPAASHESIQTRCRPSGCSDALGSDIFSRISANFARFPGHCPALSGCNYCCCNCSGFGRLAGAGDLDGSRAGTGDKRDATIAGIEGAVTSLLLDCVEFLHNFVGIFCNSFLIQLCFDEIIEEFTRNRHKIT